MIKKLKTAIPNSIFIMSLSVVFCFSMSSVYLTATIIKVPSSDLLRLSFIFVLILYMIFCNKYTMMFSFITLAVFSGIVYFGIMRSETNYYIYEEFRIVLDKVLMFVMKRSAGDEQIEGIITAFIVIIMAFFTIINMKFGFGFYLMSIFAAVSFFYPAYKNWDVSQIGMVCFLFWFVIMVINQTASYAGALKVRRASDRAGYPLMILLLGSMLLFFVWFVPKPKLATIDLAGTFDDKNLVEMTKDVFQAAAPEPNFSFSEKSGTLGGPVILSDIFVMKVTTDHRVYLRGAVYDTYENSRWRASDKNSFELSATSDNMYEISPYGETLQQSQNYYRRYYGWEIANVQIDIKTQRTKNIYTPQFSYDLDYIGENELKTNDYGMVWSQRLLDENTAYTLSHINWNYDSDYFKNILRENPATPQNMDNFDLYTTLPENFSSRVKALALDITSEDTNNFDKIKSLERYLRRFPYTLQPDKLPPNAELVDYFLFEGKEGYCVYYASSLAVMARSIGIPARYVEGFSLPPEQNINGSYTVSGQQAHAWTEVYFDQIGWVYFEPTSAYPLYGQEYIKPDEPDQMSEDSQEATGAPDDKSPSEIEESQSQSESKKPDNAESPIGQMPANSTLNLWTLAYIILTIFAFYAIKLLSDNHLAKIKRISTLPPNEAVKKYFVYILKINHELGYSIADNETPMMFAARVSKDFQSKYPYLDLEKITNIYTKASFSDTLLNDDEKNIVECGYFDLLSAYKNNHKIKLIYYIKRNLLKRF